MARPRKRPKTGFTTARIYDLAGRDLAVFQDLLHAEGMRRPSKDDLASALVWIAQQLPPVVVKAMIEAYTKAEYADTGSPEAPLDEG